MKYRKITQNRVQDDTCPICGWTHQNVIDLGTERLCTGCYNSRQRKLFEERTGKQTVFQRMATIAGAIIEHYHTDFYVHDRNVLSRLAECENPEFIWAVRPCGTMIVPFQNSLTNAAAVEGVAYWGKCHPGEVLYYHGHLREGFLNPVSVHKAVEIINSWSRAKAA